MRTLKAQDNPGTAAAQTTDDLLATAEAENKVEGGLLLDVVVSKGAAILQLLASKDETLLVWGNTLLVLDLRLDIINSVRALNLQGNGLASESLNKDLHTTPKA